MSKRSSKAARKLERHVAREDVLYANTIGWKAAISDATRPADCAQSAEAGRPAINI